MANVIKHKRGTSDPSPSDLEIGEIGIRTDVGKLFTKTDSGSVAEIAGGGSDIIINTLSSSSATGGGSATFNGSAYRFTLSQPPSVSAQQLLVSIAGVIQKPVAGSGQPSEGFSVSGNDIILASAPASGTDFFILTFKSLGVSEPADNTVTNAKVASNAAIQGTKINPNFGSQAVTAGHSSFGNLSTTGITISNTNASINFTDTNNNPDYSIIVDGGVFDLNSVTPAANIIKINTDGHIDVGTNVDFASGIDVTGDITATGSLSTGQHITLTGQNPHITFTDTNHNPDYEIYGSAGNFKIWSSTAQQSRLTVNSDGHIDLASNVDFGVGIDVTGDITATGNASVGETLTVTGNNPNIVFTDSNSNPDFKIYGSNGAFSILDSTNAVNRFVISSSGAITIGGNLDVGSGIDVTGDITGTAALGLGTTSPSALIDARTASGGTIQVSNTTTNIGKIGINVGSAENFLFSQAASSSAKRQLTFMLGQSTAAKINTDLHFIPASDSTHDLGLNGTRWRNVYADTLYGDGSNLTGISSDLVNDTSPQLGGELQSNGNDIHMADNDKIRIGGTASSSTDGFEIYHDSSASYINESGTGNLRILASNLRLANSNNQLYAFFTHNAGCEFYHTGTKKFETLSDGAVFNGDGVSEMKIADDGDGFLNASGSTIVAKGYFDYSGSVTGFYTNNLGQGVIGTKTNQSLLFLINNAVRMTLNQSGYLVPAVNNQQDLGTSSIRWRNIYTNDLNLSNEGGGNDVDQTWGSFTIQEGAEDLFLINKRNGKKYKFNLTEVK